MKITTGSPSVSIIYPPMSQLTQGSIFTCAIAEEYETCFTYGLVITARCDVEQDKVRGYNYLPIISLKDWLAHDGKLILAERFMADIRGQMKNIVKESGFSGEILETEPPKRVLEVLFPEGDKKTKKLRERFGQLCDHHDLASRCLKSGPDHNLCVQVALIAPRLKDGLIKELVHQRLAGHYFLDRVEPGGDDSGYVVLLREIRLMPKQIARLIAEGIDAKQFDALCDVEHRCRTSLHVGPDNFSMPVGVMASPFLEHLMQAFGTLFGRIGLPDPDPIYLYGLWDRQANTLKENQ